MSYESYYDWPSLFRESSERADDGGGDGSDGLPDHPGQHGWGRIVEHQHQQILWFMFNLLFDFDLHKYTFLDFYS